jgi:hypothetical protein
VRGVDYANSCPPSTAPDVLNFSVNVAGGSAFEEAGIDVHDVTRMPSFSGTIEPPHIDILVVTNNTTDTTTLEGYADGYQNHLGTRYWTWDTKGASFIGTPTIYNFNTVTEKQGTYTYHLNLMHYFYNRPFWDAPLNTAYIGLLDPVALVEDYRQENGSGPESFRGRTEDRRIENGVLDGDQMQSDWKSVSWGSQSYRSGYNFGVFDTNGNGLVENPTVDDPTTISTTTTEYTPFLVQLSTIIHEMGHGVGIAGHTSDPTCIMYENSINWDRAGHFSNAAQALIMIHNATEVLP